MPIIEELNRDFARQHSPATKASKGAKASKAEVSTRSLWAWEKYRNEIVDHLLEVIESDVENAAAKIIRWRQSPWESASSTYRENIRNRYGTTRVLGKPEPISLEGIFTDVFILDKPTAYQRHDIRASKKSLSKSNRALLTVETASN